MSHSTGNAWLLFYFKKYRGQLAAGTLFVFIAVSLGVVMPNAVGRAIDDLARNGVTQNKILYWVALILGTQLISGAFLFLQRRALINMSRYIEYDFRQDFYGHLQKLPLQYFQSQRTGDLMARATNDLGAVRMLAGPAIMYSEQTLFRLLIILPLMFTISVKLTLLLLITMPIVSVTVKYFGQQIHTRFEKIQEFFADITARAQENLTGVRVIRAYAQEASEEREFARLNQQYVERNLDLVKLSAVFRPLMAFTIGLAQVAILWYGGRETARGAMTVGEFTAFFLYLEQLIWPLIAMGYVTNMVQRGTASLKRMHEVMAVKPAIADAERRRDGTTERRESIQGKIEFRGLSFRYSDDALHVLSDINLVIEAGQTVAFIGRTGSGKSTLMNLVPRLLDATTDAAPGTVLIDDQPIRNWPLAQLRASIGYVPQETFLFSETLAENIKFGVNNHGHDKRQVNVADSAAIAGLADDVSDFPKQYETILGERGITLSGGQKQRTAIARAIIRAPQILILDDALSAVDTYTEEKILSRLRGVMGGRTTLLVAHRISTVKEADLICVLEAGRIIERGKHEELIKLGGAYADLAERQLLEEELAAA
jgi:ATP-binding cassette, subfamily B, multidrug efflux pump